MIDFEETYESPDPVRGITDPVAMQLNRVDRERLELRAAGREREEDTVTEVMEGLVGWRSRHHPARFQTEPLPT